jgi:hypothetical protein
MISSAIPEIGDRGKAVALCFCGPVKGALLMWPLSIVQEKNRDKITYVK